MRSCSQWNAIPPFFKVLWWYWKKCLKWWMVVVCAISWFGWDQQMRQHGKCFEVNIDGGVYSPSSRPCCCTRLSPGNPGPYAQFILHTLVLSYLLHALIALPHSCAGRDRRWWPLISESACTQERYHVGNSVLAPVESTGVSRVGVWVSNDSCRAIYKVAFKRSRLMQYSKWGPCFALGDYLF